MRVWVASTSSCRNGQPVLVAATLELAIIRLVHLYRRPGSDGFDEQWLAKFLDGEPHIFRLTTTVEGRDRKPVELFVETYDIEDLVAADSERRAHREIREIWEDMCRAAEDAAEKSE